MRKRPEAMTIQVRSWLALLICSSAIGPATAGVSWFAGSYEEAVRRAEAERKLLMLEAWATWCQVCYQMERDVWSREDVGRTLARTAVPYHPEVDVVAGVNLHLASRFDIAALPVTLFIDPRHEKVVLRLDGYQSTEKILNVLDTLYRQHVQTLGPPPAAGSAGAALAEAGRLMRGGEFVSARRAAQRVLAGDPDCAQDDADDAALLIADIEERQTKPRAALSTLVAVGEVCRDASGADELWARQIELARQLDGETATIKLRQRRAELFERDLDAQKDAARASLDSAQLENASRFISAARRLAEDDPMALALEAECAFRNDRFDDALATLDRAIQIDPHNSAYRELRLRITLAKRRAASAP
jgi:tetratricopeptide (TPR) repeat protein